MALAPPDAQAQASIDDVVDRLARNQTRLGTIDPKLERTIDAIVRSPPDARHDDLYRTRVAYAVQDAERLVGPLVDQGALRAELSARALTFPGLQNERVAALMQQTPSIEDREVVRDIRRLAMESARLGDHQASPDITRQVDAIENRLRLQPGAAPAGPQPASPRADDGPAGRPFHEHPQGDDAATGFRQRRSPASTPDADAAAASPSDKAPQSPRQAGQEAAQQNGPQAQPQQRNLVGDVLAGLLHAMTTREPLRQPEADAGHTPMRDRLAAFRGAQQEDADAKQLRATERAGAEAITDLKAFANGPGSSVMSRVRDAASTDPEGVAGVLAGMRAGGKYEDLGQQVQRERTVNPAFAAAQDKAAASVGAYGQAREAAAAIGERRGDEAVNAQLQKLDAEIGREASSLPGRRPGANLLDEIAEKVRDAILRAIERVSAAFSARPTAGATASPNP